MKCLILSLLLVVGMRTKSQTITITSDDTAKYYRHHYPILATIDDLTALKKEVDSLRKEVDSLKWLLRTLPTDSIQLGGIIWSTGRDKESVDTCITFTHHMATSYTLKKKKKHKKYYTQCGSGKWVKKIPPATKD